MLLSIIVYAAMQSATAKGPYWSIDSNEFTKKYRLCEDSQAARGFRVMKKSTKCSSQKSIANFYIEYYMEFDAPNPSNYLGCSALEVKKWSHCPISQKKPSLGFKKIQAFKCGDTWLIATIYQENLNYKSTSVVNIISNRIKLSCP